MACSPFGFLEDFTHFGHGGPAQVCYEQFGHQLERCFLQSEFQKSGLKSRSRHKRQTEALNGFVNTHGTTRTVRQTVGTI